MSDQNITPPITSAPVAAPEVLSNADFARLRVQADAQTKAAEAANARAAELEAKLLEIERAGMAEIDRLRLEVSESKSAKERIGRLEAAAKGVYDAELASVPEALRSQVETLSSVGDWDARLNAVRAAKGLIPSAPVAPVPVGAPTGGVRDTAGKTQGSDFDPRKMGWSAAVAMNKK